MVAAVGPNLLSTDKAQVGGSVAGLQRPRVEHMAPAFLPKLMLFAAMLSAKDLHLLAVAPSGTADELHQVDAAAATAEGDIDRRVVSTSFMALCKQVLHVVHGVGLHVPAGGPVKVIASISGSTNKKGIKPYSRHAHHHACSSWVCKIYVH